MRLAEAATGDDALSGQPLGVLGREELSDGGDVVYLACATEWGLRYEDLLEVGADDAGAVCAFGLNDAGVDGVDADLLRSQLLCEHAGDGVESAFAGGVDRAVGRSEAADAGANVDDAGAFAEMLD